MEDHDCSAAAAQTTIGDVRAYNRCLRTTTDLWSLCLMSASQNPAADYLPESRRQRNLKTRSPEIHFPAGSRNPFAQIHKSSPTCSRDFASENMQQTRNPVISSMPATDRHIVQPSQDRGSHPKPNRANPSRKSQMPPAPPPAFSS